MRLWDRLLLRGLRRHLPEDASVLAVEHGRTDALGEMRKTTAVLTDGALLLATSARTQTILTVVQRGDIRSVEVLEENVAAIRFDERGTNRPRVVTLSLQKYGDRDGILAQLKP